MANEHEPMVLWVHATTRGKDLLCSVAMRAGETLEDAISRGVSYLMVGGGDEATDVWAETLDGYAAKTNGTLMDGEFPGVDLEQTGKVRWSR